MNEEKCTSCNGPMAKQGSTEFGCPTCGSIIRRCNRCREQSVVYVCVVCGFEGP